MPNHVAGILLAAGESKRLGQPKQLLDWKGKPFVRQVAETALASLLDSVIVVTGAAAAEVSAALDGLPVTLVHNPRFAEGQSTSVQAGLAALPPQARAALFLVSDQPQLPVALIDTLRAQHAASSAPIVATLVDDQRSNPVLFDRVTFPHFAELQGDVGGRALFSRFQVTWVPWLDASLSIDVDTLEDYERLKRAAG
ncbi:MAG: nucleotidyltransferase family protein [Anaerolineales bacterium]|nr:nucleotidyltransferase family protein [Anaerolineales bacterium]MCW5854781.1 nucleotidyltransferase family protein [Anaerolineales bacterium]